MRSVRLLALESDSRTGGESMSRFQSVRGLFMLAAFFLFLLIPNHARGQSNSQEPSIDVLEMLVSIAPEDAKAQHRLGVAYFRLKRYKDAINTFKREIRIDPESAGGFKALGIIYALLGRNEEALDALLESIRLCPVDSLELTPEQYNALSRNNPRLAKKLFKGTYK